MRIRLLSVLLFVAGLAVPRRATATFPGPLRVSSNGRYFVDREGKPFFWLGDTAWPLFTLYSQSKAENYLRNRAAKGFTVVQAALAWAVGSDNPPEAIPPLLNVPVPNTAGEPLWINNNPASPNEAFFMHVDDLVAFADRQGLAVAVLLTTGQFVNQTKTITAQNARIFGRWVGKRYKDAPNIIWVNGGDRTPVGFEDVYLELARGLREGDGGAHLMTYHICGWHSSSQFFHRRDWLDFNMIQTWTDWPKVYPAVSADLAMTPPKPVVLGEGAYENGPEYPLGPITPLIVRRQAWWAVLAGGSFSYGQNQMWRMANGWEKAFDTPGAGQVCLMKKTLAPYPWWDMIPDQGLFESGVSSEQTLNAAMRSPEGNLAIVYLSSQCRVFLYLGKILTKNVKVTFVNPATGERKEGGTYATGNLTADTFPPVQIHDFVTPGFWQDAILILEGI